MQRVIAAVFLLALTLLGPEPRAQGTPIGFEEDWALASDRSKVLEQLIPGTPDHYYYHCLHKQDRRAFDEVAPLLKAWIQRHGRTQRVIRIENRQALLTFERDRAATFRFLEDRLNLRFDHQRQVAGAAQDLATSLDQSSISPAAFTRRALQKHAGTVAGFHESAFESLLAGGVDDDLLMSLLSRLRRPDVSNLPALIVRNLDHRRSRGFGSLPIHKNLLRAQLDECLRLRPNLLNERAFVDVYLRRLKPSADVDWRSDTEARLAYLDRLEAFANRLAPAHNSLKAHVLYHRLQLDLNRGNLDRDRFAAYLRLPRRTNYVNPVFLRGFRRSSEVVDVRRGFPTGFGAIGNDEPLVRAYLMHFFADADTYRTYAETVRDDYLRRLFAETKILYGIGDMERWYSLLDDPSYYEALRQRVEIEFSRTQPRYYAPDDSVVIEVDVKNVDKLLVKVFEINTFGFYRETGREIDASINLDGLVANQELTREYEDSPLRRVRRRFELPQLKGRGVWVVELIGNGLSSRAVIHKGRLNYTERLSSAGQAFTVRDEAGAPLQDAAIWFGGKRYAAKDGEIVLPYSTSPGRKSMILMHGGASTLASFRHQGEQYTLNTGFHVDREALLAGNRARILVRASLRLNGRRISLKLMEDPVLEIRARDRDGVESSLDVRDVELFADRESVHEIQVPRQLAELRVRLRGTVKSLSQGQDVQLATATRKFPVNQVDATAQTACPLLSRTASGYYLDLLGKNGEPKAARAVRLTLTHRDYTDPFTVTLKTDDRGRIGLGALAGIRTVKSSGLPDSVGVWSLDEAGRTYPGEIHGVAGETLRVPYVGDEQVVSRRSVSLLEVRDGQYVRDAFEHVGLSDGFLELRDLPAGDYSLRLGREHTELPVRVTRGAWRGDWALGRDRMLESDDRSPLHIVGVAVEGDDLSVRVANAKQGARVHIVATRYLAPFDPFLDLAVGGTPPSSIAPIEQPESDYRSGREIGDEYRYILDRRFAKKYPGNMLQRPGLILNPWALDEEAPTALGLGGGAGGKFSGRGGRRRDLGAKGAASGRAPGPAPGTFANLEFLPSPSGVLPNLRPDRDGVVRVPLKDLGGGQYVHVIAIEADATVYATLARPEQPLKPRSRTLSRALDREQHFTERRRIEFVPKDGGAVIEDVATAETETYDSLAAVYRLFASLSGNGDLAKFALLLRWPQLKPEEKRAYYDEHACHELHFFIHEKDPEFFDQVVRPYLANKMHKTFLDKWLLGMDLRGYLEPWAFARLNIVERILLSKRLAAEAPSIQRHVRELFELQARNPQLMARFFGSALRSGALEDPSKLDRKLGVLRVELKELERAAEKMPRPDAAARAPGQPGREKKATRRRARAEHGKVAADEEQEEGVKVEEPAAADDLFADKDRREVRDLARRRQLRELYRAPDPTKPLVEHNYWHRGIHEHDGGLIDVNAFWRDFALAPGGQPFVSTHVAEATGNFAEMLLALSVLDLPFAAGEHGTEVDGTRLTLQAASPLLLVRKELVPAAGAPAADSPILVSQNYYRLDEPYRYEGNQRFDAYITGEFLIDVAYGCRVVVTNPTSTPRELDLLLQIPQGAIPVNGGFFTKGMRVQLAAYATSSVEYAFYFPGAAEASHYPVHVSSDGKLVAFAPAKTLDVVPEPSEIDTTSWQYVSQNATDDEVIAYLEKANLQRTDLGKIAWRMRDRGVFAKVVDLLRTRRAYNDVLWSYGIHHGEASVAREYLRHQDGFLASCGKALQSPLVAIDPVERYTYQHIEYEPLFNARAHRVGKRREILNRHLAGQYLSLLEVLGQRPRLDDVDWMSVAYYMLLQDRVGDALEDFGRVRPERLPMRVQYDYMQAYLDFFSEGHGLAREIAERYADYPVLRWRKKFADVRNQLAELSGGDVAGGERKDRTQRQTELAAQEPALDLEVEARRVTLRYRNLVRCEVRYYEMDVEFLFSTHPFVQQGSGSFAYVRPNHSEVRELPAGESELSFDLPERFQSSNVLIEVSGAGIVRRKAYYANSLDVQWMESYGQVKVTHQASGKPLNTVYVKVFARMPGGRVRFYKDGYTDLRGRFDYASLSAQGAGTAERFAVLVLSEEHGAVIREVDPPAK